MTENKFETIQGDDAFYMKKENDKLLGMLLVHVNVFMVAGTASFVEDTKTVLRKSLTVSKEEKNSFRFCGVDIRLFDNKIEVNMDSYVDSLQEIPLVPGRKKKETLDAKEVTLFRKVTGKIGWLVANCRPDLAYIQFTCQ